VFPGGPPPEYYHGPVLVDFKELTGFGRYGRMHETQVHAHYLTGTATHVQGPSFQTFSHAAVTLAVDTRFFTENKSIKSHLPMQKPTPCRETIGW